MKKLASTLFYFSAPCLCLAWLLGWIAKDRTPLTLWLYFIPAVAVLLYGTCWLAVLPAARGGRVQTLVRWVTILAAAKIGLVDFAWNLQKPEPAGAALRIVHWNVGRWDERADNQFKTLAGDRPDLCVLSESPRHVDLADLSKRHLAAPFMQYDAGMTLISKYPFDSLGTIKLTNAKAWAARVHTPKGPLDLVLVDLISRPSLARLAPITELSAWIAARPASVPLLVLGDFNTPRDAVSFDPLRRQLRNAYEIAGRGWPYSWPALVPVYSIDHAWVSPSVRVLNYTLETSVLSDHRRQVMDVDIVNAGGPGFVM